MLSNKHDADCHDIKRETCMLPYNTCYYLVHKCESKSYFIGKLFMILSRIKWDRISLVSFRIIHASSVATVGSLQQGC